jgi:hypothetical protein
MGGDAVNLKSLVFLLMAPSLALSCDAFRAADGPPPFTITMPVSVAGEKPGCYAFAGVEFTYLNTSPKTVAGVSVSFMVFDAVTKKSPFIGSNIIKATFDGEIKSGGKKDFIISLDPYLYAAPAVPYLIDFFYISKVAFADGSVWEDSGGAYHTGSG